jgi:hypothetical protein
MTVSIICSECSDLVGIRDEASDDDFDPTMYLPCPGKGRHLKGEIRTRKRWFGLIREVRWLYPETMTYTKWRRAPST